MSLNWLIIIELLYYSITLVGLWKSGNKLFSSNILWIAKARQRHKRRKLWNHLKDRQVAVSDNKQLLTLSFILCFASLHHQFCLKSRNLKFMEYFFGLHIFWYMFFWAFLLSSFFLGKTAKKQLLLVPLPSLLLGSHIPCSTVHIFSNLKSQHFQFLVLGIGN